MPGPEAPARDRRAEAGVVAPFRCSLMDERDWREGDVDRAWLAEWAAAGIAAIERFLAGERLADPRDHGQNRRERDDDVLGGG